MLSILDRYFLRELAQTVAATTIVLVAIITGTTFAKVLQQVAGGSFPASVMFTVLGLRTLDGLTNLLPLAGFLGVMMALGRMYRESEMHVLASSGMGPRGLLKPVAILAGIIVLVTGVVSLWLGPWAVRTADALVAEANRSVIADGLEDGRFTELTGNGGIIIVDRLNLDGSVLGKTFVATESGDSDGVRQLKLVTAAAGQLYQESNGEGRFMALRNGWQYKIPLGRDDWWRMEYARNDVALSDVKADEDEDPAHAQGTWALAASPSPDARAEFAWLVHAPPMAFVLLMLALPLSRQSPREPRYGRILLALLGFYFYYLLLALGRAQIGKGHWANSLPLVLVHLLALALAGWLFWKQYAPRKRRGPRKAVA